MFLHICMCVHLYTHIHTYIMTHVHSHHSSPGNSKKDVGSRVEVSEIVLFPYCFLIPTGIRAPSLPSKGTSLLISELPARPRVAGEEKQEVIAILPHRDSLQRPRRCLSVDSLAFMDSMMWEKIHVNLLSFCIL